MNKQVDLDNIVLPDMNRQIMDDILDYSGRIGYDYSKHEQKLFCALYLQLKLRFDPKLNVELRHQNIDENFLKLN